MTIWAINDLRSAALVSFMTITKNPFIVIARFQ